MPHPRAGVSAQHTEPGGHRLWVDRSGNVYYRDDPRNDGQRLREMRVALPGDLWKGSHPFWRISGQTRYCTFYAPPANAPGIGRVLLVWYQYKVRGGLIQLFQSEKVWLMLREDKREGAREGQMLVSSWKTSDLKGVDPPPPEETRVHGDRLHQIQSAAFSSAEYSATARTFRDAWSKVWRVPVTVVGNVELPDNPTLGDVFGGIGKGTADLAGAAAEKALPKTLPFLLPIVAVVALAFFFMRKRG